MLPGCSPTDARCAHAVRPRGRPQARVQPRGRMQSRVQPRAWPLSLVQRSMPCLVRCLALCLVVCPVLSLAPTAALAGADAPGGVRLRPASRVAHAASASVLGSARAGARIVAVGEHGVVLLSDDEGRSWRQAKAVPVSSTLTDVRFADARNGWAVGHWGVIVHTADGGETWQVQRVDTAHDRPLFALHAFDRDTLLAVGLWSLALRSIDGGRSWSTVALPPPPAAAGSLATKADLNLLGLFGDAQGRVFAAAERGMVLRSADRGASWSYLATGYKGSFWTGVSPAAGQLLLGGLRGTIYRSDDDGQTWARVDSGSTGSVTAMAASGARVVAVGLDGLQLRSADGGRHFAPAPRTDHAALTSVLLRADGSAVLFSRAGPLGESR